MNGPLAIWIFAAALLLGCQGQRPAYDPFGRTTIPPPATGAVAAPGYGGPLTTAPLAISVPTAPSASQFAPPATAPAPLNVPIPATPGLAPIPGAAPAGTAPSLQPGVRVPNPSPPWSGSVRWAPHPAGNPVAATSPTVVPPLMHSPRLQPASPFETGIAATAPTPPTPAPMAMASSTPTPISAPTPIAATTPTPAVLPASQVVVIDNGSRGEPVIRVEDASRLATLQRTPITPTVATTPSPSAARWTSGDSPKAITPVSGTTPVSLASHNESSILVPSGSGKSNINPTAVSSPKKSAPASTDYESRYGHAPDYTRLKGKLEYSAARKQWKLRYVPIDAAGPADQYGGSVILSGLPDMSQFHEGDFVSVEGAVGQRADDAKDFAASYQVRQLTRLEAKRLELSCVQ